TGPACACRPRDRCGGACGTVWGLDPGCGTRPAWNGPFHAWYRRRRAHAWPIADGRGCAWHAIPAGLTDHGPAHGRPVMPVATWHKGGRLNQPLKSPSAGSSLPLAGLAPVRPIPLPRQLSDAEFGMFMRAGERRLLRAGGAIFRRGESGRHMYVIESGRVLLEFGDGRPDKLLGPREFFGELTLFIGNHLRVAGASVVSDAVVYLVEHSAFEALLQEQPVVMASFMRRSFAYLVSSEQQLIAHLKRRNEDLLRALDSLRRTEAELGTVQRLLRTDDLTGLCNRRGLYLYLEELDRHRQPDRQLALLLVDVDGFKRI